MNDGGTDRTRPECACDAGASIGEYFDRNVRRRGAPPELHATSRALLDLLGSPNGRTVLELGAGRGGLLLETLRSGAERGTGVDLSPVSLEIARQRLRDAGLADRATLTVGDGAAMELPPSDMVVLDRVICCYPGMDSLVANASGAARRRIGFAVPDSRGWRGWVARAAIAIENLWHRSRGISCRTFVHDVGRIEAAVASAGFRKLADANRGLWYVAVFERSNAG